jgi:hypothetical protein
VAKNHVRGVLQGGRRREAGSSAAVKRRPGKTSKASAWQAGRWCRGATSSRGWRVEGGSRRRRLTGNGGGDGGRAGAGGMKEKCAE